MNNSPSTATTAHVLRLPSELILLITEAAGPVETIFFALTCRDLYQYLPRRRILRRCRQQLIPLFEKYWDDRYYCHVCNRLHNWTRAWQERGFANWRGAMIECCPEGRRGSQDAAQFESEKYLVTQHPGGDCKMDRGDIRLLMNRHFHGRSHGLPPDILNRRSELRVDDNGGRIVSEWRARPSGNALVVSATHFMYGKKAMLVDGLAICPERYFRLDPRAHFRCRACATEVYVEKGTTDDDGSVRSQVVKIFSPYLHGDIHPGCEMVHDEVHMRNLALTLEEYISARKQVTKRSYGVDARYAPWCPGVLGLKDLWPSKVALAMELGIHRFPFTTSSGRRDWRRYLGSMRTSPPTIDNQSDSPRKLYSILAAQAILNEGPVRRAWGLTKWIQDSNEEREKRQLRLTMC